MSRSRPPVDDEPTPIMPMPPDAAPPADSGSFDAVIDRSERIQDAVEQCADELSSVNEVIKGQLETTPALADVDGVADAITRSESIEVKVQACADELSDVNEALIVEARQRKELEHELDAAEAREHVAREAALHDPLTGLPNRALFEDRLDQGFAQARRHGWTMAVMFIDLDDFKVINDTYGHEVGDQVLRTVASRLKKMTRADDTVCRYGGDEFLYLMLELKSVDNAAAIARKIIDTIGAPLHTVRGTATLQVRCSIGIALHPQHASDPDALIECADRAMYRAKRSGSGFVLHAPTEACASEAS